MGGTCRLEKTLEMPAEDDNHLGLVHCQGPAHVGSVTAVKADDAGARGNVTQKAMAISAGEIGIPIEADSEASFCLIVVCRSMAEVDVQVNPLGERPKQWRVILDWMAANDGDAHRTKDGGSSLGGIQARRSVRIARR